MHGHHGGGHYGARHGIRWTYGWGGPYYGGGRQAGRPMNAAELRRWAEERNARIREANIKEAKQAARGGGVVLLVLLGGALLGLLFAFPWLLLVPFVLPPVVLIVRRHPRLVLATLAGLFVLGVVAAIPGAYADHQRDRNVQACRPASDAGLVPMTDPCAHIDSTLCEGDLGCATRAAARWAAYEQCMARPPAPEPHPVEGKWVPSPPQSPGDREKARIDACQAQAERTVTDP
jgi:hypothetical protein